MRKVWLAIRSAILWSLSILHFFMFSPQHALGIRLPQLREYMHGQVHGLRHGLER